LPEHKVSVFGLGRVGLVSAACFASRGFETVCFDVNESTILQVRRGRPPFFEPGLGELVRQGVESGALKATNDSNGAVFDTDITFITVGTPSNREGGIDLTQMENACRIIGEALSRKTGSHLVVVKSTVAPTTTETVIKPALEKTSGKHCRDGFGLCVNPEFLREGSAVEDTLKPDRIVIGDVDDKSGDALEFFYKELYGNLPPTIRTTATNAELIKYANNAYLAVKVSFINNIANLCETIPRADVVTVAEGIALDPRIGPLFLRAGFGWGGSCLPKDVKALLQIAESRETELPVVEAAFRSNETQPSRAVHLTEKTLGGLKSKVVAVLGLSFKPGTDDMRDAVSIKIVDELLKKGAKVLAFDPYAMTNAMSMFQNKVQFCTSPEECISGADCCMIVTEWDEFKRMRPEDFVSRMKRPLVIDGRRIYDPDRFSRILDYVAIGRGP
jgi:UDPglucose 6-dehydrogenase